MPTSFALGKSGVENAASSPRLRGEGGAAWRKTETRPGEGEFPEAQTCSGAPCTSASLAGENLSSTHLNSIKGGITLPSNCTCQCTRRREEQPIHCALESFRELNQAIEAIARKHPGFSRSTMPRPVTPSPKF